MRIADHFEASKSIAEIANNSPSEHFDSELALLYESPAEYVGTRALNGRNLVLQCRIARSANRGLPKRPDLAMALYVQAHRRGLGAPATIPPRLERARPIELDR